VVDLRERKALRKRSFAPERILARVARVSTVGELAASIAHEINQPLAAVPRMQVRAAVAPGVTRRTSTGPATRYVRTVQENEHAERIVSRVRALVKKVPPRTEVVDIDEVILEVLDLSRNELQRNGSRSGRSSRPASRWSASIGSSFSRSC